VHISGLEVEGRHPRALMESALLLLQQVIGLAGPAPRAGWKEAGLPGYAITRHSCNLEECFSSRQRGGTARREQEVPR
jgi:hypothetical protein